MCDHWLSSFPLRAPLAKSEKVAGLRSARSGLVRTTTEPSPVSILRGVPPASRVGEYVACLTSRKKLTSAPAVHIRLVPYIDWHRLFADFLFGTTMTTTAHNDYVCGATTSTLPTTPTAPSSLSAPDGQMRNHFSVPR